MENLYLTVGLGNPGREYERTQFRLGSLQHLNARLGDPRVAHQIEELVMTVRALAGER